MPVVPANLQCGYRRRIHLVLRREGDGYQAGYIAVDNRSLVPVKSCPIFTEHNDPILEFKKSADSLNPMILLTRKSPC